MATHTTTKRQFHRDGLLRTLALLVVTLLLSACVNVEIGSEYLLDGSATHSIQIAISPEPDDRVSRLEITSFLDGLERRASDAGLEFARIEEQGVTTVRITGTTSDGQDAGASINGLINATGLNATPGVTAPFRGTFARETGAVGGTAYILDLTVDGQLLFDSVAVSVTGEQEAALREGLTLRYVATLPGDITETTGERVTDSSVRWEIPTDGEEANLQATSRTGGSGSAALFIILGIVAIIAVIIIAAGLGWYFARRNRLANALGGGLHRLPGQRTITTEGAWVAAKIGGLTRRLSRSKPDKR